MTKEMDKNTGGEWTHQSHDVTGAMVPEMPATYAERKPIWIVMRRTGMSYRQIGEASGVAHTTVMDALQESTGVNTPVDLPATVVGKDGKERAATKQKAQTLITSTTGVIAISTAASDNNRRGPSHYASHAAKSGNFEATTRCSQNLGGLSLRVSQLFPVSETPTENQKNKNKVCRNRRTF